MPERKNVNVLIFKINTTIIFIYKVMLVFLTSHFNLIEITSKADYSSEKFIFQTNSNILNVFTFRGKKRQNKEK